MKNKIIAISFVFISILVLIYFFLSDDNDYCLDTGYCKAGLKLNTEYGFIEINKENCLKYNWKWDDESKYCNIRQIKSKE